MNYREFNAKAIDRWCEAGWIWGVPIDHETYIKATQGEWNIVLTPTKSVPKDWFGELKGKKLLGLACGGGQQMPILTAAGAHCTVLDYSERQLASERAVAEREDYSIDIVRADMTQPLPFADESFDIIFHPISMVYIKEPEPIFRECFRVLKKGGRFLGAFSNEVNYIVGPDEKAIVCKMPFDALENQEQWKLWEGEDSAYEFSHTMEEQIAGQLKAGFCLKDIYEDTNGAGYLHELNIKTFYATLSVKP